MVPLIFLALILVPIAEIAIFIKVGSLIGVVPTVGLVVAIAVFGTWLLKRQGLRTFTKAQAAFNRGEMPVGELLDGSFLVLAALLMVTPGLLTDVLGFALLVPAVRRLLGPLVARWAMARTTTVFHGGGHSGAPRPPSGGPIIEGEASVVGETDPRDHGANRRPIEDRNHPKGS
ncbi:MAG TPA: FxsA family protein [Parvibaculum sp.]